MSSEASHVEQDDRDRSHGQEILDLLAANEARRQEDHHPLVQALIQAHQAHDHEAKDDKE